MLMAGLVLFGWISFERMGVSQLPDVDFPIVTVQLKYDGASPEVMELDVVDVVEDAVMAVQGIKKVTSVSKNAQASVTVEFELNRDIDDALREVQTKIAQAQQRLPLGMDPPVVTKNNPEDNPIMWVSLSGNLPPRDIMSYARDRLKHSLQTVSGVSDIIFGGYIEPNLRVWVDPERLAKYELTVQDVIDAVGKEHVEIPAGRVESATKEFELRFMGEAPTPEQFADILIQKRGEGGPVYQPIRVGDVARMEMGLDEVRRISRTNLKPAIGLGIKKQRGSNAVSVAASVRKKLDEIRPNLPRGLSVQVNFDGTKFIEESTRELSFTLLLSALLTGVVCLLFLGSWRSAFNILLAIPTSIVGSFTVLYFMGFTLNTFTLLGLILAIGIVVDDAIMVLENIVRHQELGKGRVRAAIDGAREITPAAVATTLAIVAIFVPVVFMGGIIGKFFSQFGVTMAVAVALSLVEALTLTPMRASRFVDIGAREKTRLADRAFAKLSGLYGRFLTFCLNRRWLVIAVALATFFASFALLPGLRKEALPSQDQGSFLIRLETPLGSSIHFTDKTMDAVEKTILARPEILRYYLAVGGFSGGDVNSAMVFVTMRALKERPPGLSGRGHVSQAETMTSLREELANVSDVKVFMQDLSLSAFSAQRGMPIEFGIRGPDWDKLTGLVSDFKERMGRSGFFTDIDSNYKFGMPELRILPLRDEAAKRGVSLDSIGKTVNALVGGLRIGKFSEDGHRNDIRIRVDPKRIDAADVVKGLSVRNYRGELIPLSDVVKIERRETLQSITRENRERAISVYANFAAGVSQERALEKVSELAAEALPSGYYVVFSGSAQAFKESFLNLGLVLILGIAVAYMVLGSQYNSFLHPFTVLLALPFSLSGALVALKIADQSLNIYSFIGIILLMGIVKKNSILLVDFTNQRRKEGMAVREALLTACPQRLRPVLMTTFATMAAAIPPALSLGPGAETQVPMAVVVLGGVAVSTVLTLFVVPCAYSLAARLEMKQGGEEPYALQSGI